jgi:plastocyanin
MNCGTFYRSSCRLLLVCLAVGASSVAQERAVTARIEVVKSGTAEQGPSPKKAADASSVVLWLVPLDHSDLPRSAPSASGTSQLLQRNKSFEPHLLVVEVGTEVQFPNKDPFFHNIFSLFDGKPFDLGLYEAGSSRTVRFDRPGVSYLFCNIHAEMSGVVVTVETPYFGISDRAGHIRIPDVPDGRYQMHVWYERGLPEHLEAINRRVVISESSRWLGSIRVVTNASFTPLHKNKYGQDYAPPTTPAYIRP